MIYNNYTKAKHTKQIYFIKLKYTIEVYNSDNEYRFSIWLLYTVMVYVYCYSILYHAIILSLDLTKVYYSCTYWYADVYYTMWVYNKHILNEYTLHERILYMYIINVYHISIHWRKEGNEWILIQDDE